MQWGQVLAPEEQREESLADLIADFVDLSSQYIRQETQAIVDKAVISPARRLGFWLAFTIVAATLFALAAIFLSVGAFQLLAALVGAPWIAYLIIGSLLLLAGASLLVLRQKLGENSGEK